MTNDYRVLGVPPKASIERIRARYIELMSVHHPDKGGSSEVCASVSLSYHRLKDRKCRQKLDTALGLSSKPEDQVCPRCEGRGERLVRKMVPCKSCEGTGFKIPRTEENNHA